MRRKALSIILGITSVVAMAIGGCGGGGGGGTSSATPATVSAKVVSGTASSGAAFSGSVVLKDARGKQLSMNTTTGAFTFDVTTLTAPFILKAGTLYSIATAEGTTNINPFTHIVAKSAAGSSIDIDTVFANVSSNRSKLSSISSNIPLAITNFNTSMNQQDSSGTSIYTKYGMTSPPDFMNSKITIDQDVDKLFADINVTVTGSTVTVTNKSGAPLMTGSYSVSGSTVSYVFTPDYTNIGGLSGSTTPPVTTAGVSISPTSASVSTGGSTTFAATVTGASNGAVTWSVVDTGGGSITSSGVYTAPTTAGTYHVKATSAADTTKSATATVTVTAAAVASGPFPIGTWVGPQGVSFTVTRLVTGDQYAGSVTYKGGTITVSGTGSILNAIQVVGDMIIVHISPNNSVISFSGSPNGLGTELTGILIIQNFLNPVDPTSNYNGTSDKFTKR
jgi:hypothetical protein